VVSSPAIAADGTIYFGSHDKKLYALKPDGSKKWEFATGGPITSSPAIDYSGNIYFSSVDGKFYVLNPDGKLRWSLRTGGITESSPVLANDGSIYICINDSRAAISADGKIKGSHIIPDNLLDPTPAVGADGRVFYTAMDGTISAILLEYSIQSAWEKAPITASPLIAPDGMVYAPVWSGILAAVEGDTTLLNGAWPMFRANIRHTGVVNAPAH
jgi:eukaryotic-like serine/threonine-protein kinase